MNTIIIDVVIPAFNEQESIEKVINDIPHKIVRDIVVVDNKSTDKTAINAEKAGAAVLSEKRQGYGWACLKGIHYLEEKNKQPDILVFLDGDYSDYPQQLDQLIKPIIDSDFDMVIGSRALGDREKGSMTIPQLFGNWLSTRLMKIIYGAKFTDLGPFRAIKFKKLLEMDMQDKTYGWTVEMQIKAAKLNYRYTEVAVDYRKRIGFSKVSGTIKGAIMAGIKIIYLIFKYY